MSDFTDRIEALLAEKSLSKSAFINDVGIPKQSLYDWKQRGTIPAADVVLRIAVRLGTSVEYLLTGADSNPLRAENAALKDKISRIVEIAGE